jgi:hypothetical protein
MSARLVVGVALAFPILAIVACSSAESDDSATAASQRVTEGPGTTGAEGGTSEAGTSEAGTSEAGDDGTGPCGFYKKKTCDPGAVVSYFANDLRTAIEDTADCLGCAGTLIGAGVVAMGGTVSSAGLISVPAGALATAVAAVGCEECWHELNDSGFFAALDCSLSLVVSQCEYSDDARQKECKLICQTTYAYVARGSTNCMCTDDLKEAECRLSCYDGYKVVDGCKCAPK